MTSFKLAFHGVTGRRIIEVYDDKGAFVAGIYPGGDAPDSIHIVSKHFDTDPVKPTAGEPPGLLVRFTGRS